MHIKQINWNMTTVKILWFRVNRALQMSRSRSLSYCSRSYSCRLIRFTRRRRRSGTAWGLEKEPHTHTSACTCTHTQFRHPPTYNNKDMYIHTCTHRHAKTRKSQTKSELLQRKDTSSFVIQLIFKTLTDNWKFAKTSKRNKISLW